MAGKQKRYNQLIDVNLIHRLKEFELTPPNITGFRISRMEYLISLILTHKQDNHQKSWSILKMEYLRNIVPRADEYMKLLKDEGIIEWKNYSAGRNSRLYRLKNEGKTELRPIVDKQLIRRIEKNRSSLQAKNSRKYPNLNKTIFKVKIDTEEAIRTVEAKYSLGHADDPAKAESRRTFSIAEIEKINSGDIYIKCNSTNGRLDTNYIRLPSELVRHLSIDGCSLIEIDIRNSQPFFAAALMNPTEETESLMKRYLGLRLTKSLKSLSISENVDVKLYTSLVVSGTFYEPFLLGEFSKEGIVYVDRSEVKERLFRLFFGKRGTWRYDKGARVFKSLFPNVVRFIDHVKEKDYRLFPVFLQRMESYTVLERVAPELYRKFPELDFITKHDSILYSSSLFTKGSNEVSKVISDVISQVTGLIPQMKHI